MRQEEHNTLILRPGRPTGGLFGKSLTVGPYEVGIVVRDGELQPPFSEGTRRLPRGSKMEAYVASTAPFNLVFWLDDPGDPAGPAQGISLDQPALTADGLPVTGRIELTLSVTPEHAARLLRLRIMGHHEIRASDVSNAIKGELVAKVLALQLHRYTSNELRGNRAPLQDIFGSTKTELASTMSSFGLRLDNFNVSWGLTLQEREHIKEARHRSAMRDLEREGELEEARWRREPARNSETIEQAPPPPSGTASETPTDADSKIGAGRDFGGPSEPGNQGEQPRGAWDPRWVLALAVVAIVGLAGGLLYFTGFDSSPASPEESSTATQPVASELAPISTSIPTPTPATPTPTPTSVPTPVVTPHPTVAVTLAPIPVSIPTPISAELARGDLSCFSPCVQRSDPLKASFDNFLIEATFFNPTSMESFKYGFTIDGELEDGIHKNIEIRVANDRTWRAYIQKSGDESSAAKIDQWQIELGGGEIPNSFIDTSVGGSNKLEAAVLQDEGCLYVNSIFISCFDLSNRTFTRDIAVSSELGNVQYNGFIAREAPAGTEWPFSTPTP